MHAVFALCVGARAHGHVTVCVTCRHVVVCITCTGCMLGDRCGLKGPALTRNVAGGLLQDLTHDIVRSARVVSGARAVTSSLRCRACMHAQLTGQEHKEKAR